MTDFIIIGNANAAISKNVFPLFKDGKVRFGYSKRGMDFDTDEGVKNINAVWYVTFPVKRKPLILTQKYDPEKYHKFDNYDAIEVSKVKDIPYDYEGVMGVPITFLDKWCDGFEIVGRGGDIEYAKGCGFFTPPTEEKAEEYKSMDNTWRVQNPYFVKCGSAETAYNRIFIKIDGILYGEFTEIDGEYIKGHRPVLNGEQMYSRVLIRRKEND